MPISSGLIRPYKDINRIVLSDDNNEIKFFDGKVESSYIRKIKGGYKIVYKVPMIDGIYNVKKNGDVFLHLCRDGKSLFSKHITYYSASGRLTVTSDKIEICIVEGVL